MHKPNATFSPLAIAVLTVSDTRTFESDTSGDTLSALLTGAGHVLADRRIVKDDIWKIRAAVTGWIADETVQVVLVTGGTGFTLRDNTPQALEVLFERRVDGFGEAFRAISMTEIGMSTMQSRAVAGMSNGTLVVCMPGSPGACRTAWNGILQSQLDRRTGPCNFVAHLKNRPDNEVCSSR